MQLFPYPNLLSESDQSYSLLVIGDNENPIEENKKITETVNDILSLPELDMAQTAYPKLNIKTEPAYILFDQAGVIHQSKDIKELTKYLEQNKNQDRFSVFFLFQFNHAIIQKSEV
jgi:hypothetical protein